MRRRTDHDEQPLRLHVGPAPHLVGGDSFSQITRTMLAGATLVGLAGVALFGLGAIRILAVAVGTAVAAEWGFVRASNGRMTPTYDHAALMGLLLGLTLPVGLVDAAGYHPLPWFVPLVASLTAIVVGKGLLGGFGNYLWHPALVGRVVAELLYPERMHPKLWIVLSPGHLFAARPDPVAPEGYLGWRESEIPESATAWALDRPVELLREAAEAVGGRDGVLLALIRDRLPPWDDTLIGGTPGGIGETSSLLLAVCGLYLVYRGYVRWFQPASVLVGVVVAAVVLPIPLGDEGGLLWMPGFSGEAGLPLGLVYVLFHLTTGQLMFGAVFLATDTVSSPRTGRGQVLFGLGIGALTIAMRLYIPVPGSCYWSILAMNTFVGLIDRYTLRRVMGT